MKAPNILDLESFGDVHVDNFMEFTSAPTPAKEMAETLGIFDLESCVADALSTNLMKFVPPAPVYDPKKTDNFQIGNPKIPFAEVDDNPCAEIKVLPSWAEIKWKDDYQSDFASLQSLLDVKKAQMALMTEKLVGLRRPVDYIHDRPEDKQPWTDDEIYGPRSLLFQGAFDRMLIGMRRQRAKATNDPEFGHSCMYRGYGGSRCIVGMLIDERDYHPRLEGNTDPDVIRAIGLPHLANDIRVLAFFEEARVRLHDSLPPYGFMAAFEERAQQFARDHGLKYRYPGDRVAKVRQMATRYLSFDEEPINHDYELEFTQF